MPDIGLDVATIVAAWCEAVLFGVFLVLFAISVYILGPLSLRTTGRVNAPLLATSIALLLLIGGHGSVCLRRVLQAFTENEPTPGAVEFLSDTRQWTEPVTDLIYGLVTLLGDVILIYRCYVVWARKWYVVVPSLILWIGTAVTMIRSVVMQFDLQDGEGIFASQLNGWIEAFFACTMATNGLTTALIVLRIWKSNIDVRRFGQSNLGPVMAIILESGALYSITVFVLLMLYVAQTNAQYIVLAMEIPIIGIVFSLIIVRVGLNRTMKTNSGITPHTRSLSVRGLGSRDQHELKRVTIARTVEMDSSMGDDELLDIRSMKADRDLKTNPDEMV